MLRTTVDGNGGFHLLMHEQTQGMTGFGETTGDKYQEQERSFTHRVSGEVGSQYTFLKTYMIIGQGPGNNFLVHSNYHLSVNANGEVTTEVSNYRVECK